MKIPKPDIKTKVVTVNSVASDSKNMFPPLNQILKTVIFSPSNQGLMDTHIVPALGTIQIMVGLFNIGLGPGRTSTNPGDLTSLGAAYWLGAVFIVTGIMSILAGQFPSSCLVGFTVFMDITGAIFAITAIALYGVDLTNASLVSMCDQSCNETYGDESEDNCINVALYAQTLVTSVDTTMIAMAFIQLFVSARVAFLGIKALTMKTKKGEGVKDVEDQQLQF